MIPPFNKLGNFFSIYFVALPAAIETVSAVSSPSQLTLRQTAASEALLDDYGPPNYL